VDRQDGMERQAAGLVDAVQGRPGDPGQGALNDGGCAAAHAGGAGVGCIL
jgi:hypothetical protein